MAVVDLKVPKRKRGSRGLPLDQASGAARFFGRMVREIESDLGGHRILSRIQRELLQAFAGAATQIQYLNHQVLIGETSELDFATYAQLASTMLRIGSRLGLHRHAKLVPGPDEYLARLPADEPVPDGEVVEEPAS